jgi:hypothetical protein
MRRIASTITVLVATGLLALPAVSLAQATIERSSETYTAEPFLVDDICAGAGVVGILTGTGTITRLIINTATNEHGTATNTFDYRVDFGDGSYLLASERGHDARTGSEFLTTAGGTVLEMGTLYDAAGNVIGHEMFHARGHTTFVNGTVVVSFDEGFITCR